MKAFADPMYLSIWKSKTTVLSSFHFNFNSLLRIRSDANAEITRMIMLRERRTGTVTPRDGDCDCGILSEVLDGLDKVVDMDDGAVVAAGEKRGNYYWDF